MNIRKELLYIYSLVLIVTFGYHLISHFLPIYLDSLGISLLNIGVIYAFAAIIAGILRFPVGAISDTFGRRPLLLIGVLGYPLFAILIAFSQNTFFFASAKVIFNIFSMVFWVGIGAYLFDVVSKKHEGRQIAGGNIVSCLSAAVAPLIAGVIIASLGFTNLFYISAAVTASAIPLALLIEKNKTRKHKKIKIDWEYLQKEYSDIINSKGFRIVAFICVLTNFVWAFWYLLFPIYLTQLGFSTVVIGGVLTVNLLFIAFFHLFLGKWTDSMSGRWLIIPGFFLMWLSGYALIWTRNLIGYALSRIGYSTGISMSWHPAYASLARRTPKKEHGGAVGLFGAVTSLAYAFGALIAGWMAEVYSVKFALMTSSTIALIMGVILLLMSKHIIKARWLYSYTNTKYKKHHVTHEMVHKHHDR